MATAHRCIRVSCDHCGSRHHKPHEAYGEGSFKATHPGYCRKHTCNNPNSLNYKRKKKRNDKCGKR